MANVTLSVPASVMRAARAKLGGGGEAQVKEYLLNSLKSLADDHDPLDRDTLRALLEGADSPALRATDAYWQRKLRNYKSRHRRNKPKRSA